LYGKDLSKGQLLVKSIKRKLITVINSEIENFNNRLMLYLKSKDELQQYLIKFENDKKQNKLTISKIKNEIKIYQNDMKNFEKTLVLFLQDEFIELKNNIQQRVFSDVKYSLEKTKKIPQLDRITIIIQTTIKDGIVDIIRDYRYKATTKLQKINEIYNIKYQDFKKDISLKENLKSGFLISTNKLLISKITNEVQKCKKNNLVDFDRKLNHIIKDDLDSFLNDTKDKALLQTKDLIDDFFIKLNKPLRNFEQKIQQDEQNIKNQINFLNNDEEDKEKKILQIYENIKQLENISKGLRL
jgi:hypothetical protein